MNAVVFIVDSNDAARHDEAREGRMPAVRSLHDGCQGDAADGDGRGPEIARTAAQTCDFK